MSVAYRVTEAQSKTVPLVRGRPRHDAGRGIHLAALRVPLAAKLVGANLGVIAILALAWLASGASITPLILGAMFIVVALHVALVFVALRPIRDLEEVAGRVWRGDFGARVDRSAVADREVLRVGAMFNILLDGLAADRARMRALATEVIEVGDRERAALARELHDSTAQRLAALLLQISAAARDCRDPDLAARLVAARNATEELTEEVRLMAQTVHPGVLDDLGLIAALQKLGRDASHGTGIDVDADAAPAASRLPHRTATVLYRVAQEAIHNAVRHASPRRVKVVVTVDDTEARMEVRDDGCGFDLSAAARQEDGMGLKSMRERVALVDGLLEIRTAERGGTSIIATIPLSPPPEAT